MSKHSLGNGLAILVITSAFTGGWVLSGDRGSSVDGDLGALSVRIVGDDVIAPNEECAWQANASGGTTPYSYDWWGGVTGTTRIVFGSLAQSSYVWVEVTDSSTPTQVDTASFFTAVEDGAECQF